VTFDEMELRLPERLDALGPAPRAELLHVLMLPDLERAERIGDFWSYPQSRTFAGLLIDAAGFLRAATGSDGESALCRYSSAHVCSIDMDSPCDIPAAFVAPSRIVRSSRRSVRTPVALACAYSERPEYRTR
jgi:hypothetical protein